jgi:hypothetical protein
VPDGPFTALPFGLLVTRPSREAGRNEEYRSIPWLQIKTAISVSPGATSVVAFRRTPVAGSSRLNLLGVGDPVLPSVRPQATLADLYGSDVRPSLRRLPRLPETSDELRAIAESMGGRATLLLGPDATRVDVRHAVKANAYRVMAFATHGIVGTSSSEPGLLLSAPKDQPEGDPDLLTSGDIGSLPLNTDLVVLSPAIQRRETGLPTAKRSRGWLARFLVPVRERCWFPIGKWIARQPLRSRRRPFKTGRNSIANRVSPKRTGRRSSQCWNMGQTALRIHTIGGLSR